MNRREFTRGLAAAGLAPALPLPSLAKAAPAAMAAKDPMYFWANFVSRVHNKCSPAMLSRLLKLEPEHSAKLFSQLMADGAVTAPDIYGLSQSTNPLYPEYSRVMGHGKKMMNSLDKSNDNKALKDTLGDQDEASEEITSEEDALETDEITARSEALEIETTDAEIDTSEVEIDDDLTDQDEDAAGFTSS